VAADDRFDPLACLATLERHRVAYAVIGSLARVLQGTDELANGIDICPQVKDQNLERLDRALKELEARPARGRARRLDLVPLGAGEPLAAATSVGPMLIVPLPAGTRNGYDDLRRQATREPLGGGVRAPVASVSDLVRMAAALGREQDAAPLAQLRRLQERERGIGIAR
jgi:hypothetical protein